MRQIHRQRCSRLLGYDEAGECAPKHIAGALITNSPNSPGECCQLPACVIVEPVTDEFTRFTVTIKGIATASGHHAKSFFGSAQNLSSLVTYSFRIDSPCPNTGDKNSQRIQVHAKSPVPICTCDCEHRARASHWVQNSQRTIALAQGFKCNAWRHARRKRMNRTASKRFKNRFLMRPQHSLRDPSEYRGTADALEFMIVSPRGMLWSPTLSLQERSPGFGSTRRFGR